VKKDFNKKRIKKILKEKNQERKISEKNYKILSDAYADKILYDIASVTPKKPNKLVAVFNTTITKIKTRAIDKENNKFNKKNYDKTFILDAKVKLEEENIYIEDKETKKAIKAYEKSFDDDNFD
jgi:hypothetical protein